MSAKRIYVEGASGGSGDSAELNIRCREGFRKLLEKSGLEKRVPRIVACGSRKEAYDTFKTAQENNPSDYLALIVDSEDPVADINAPWAHLSARDGWKRPANASDEQAFLMTNCMETWIIADRQSLKTHYKSAFRPSALPPLNHLERRNRHEVQDKLETATKDCTNAYKKNKRSFEALAAVDTAVLKTHLPSFARMVETLDKNL